MTTITHSGTAPNTILFRPAAIALFIAGYLALAAIGQWLAVVPGHGGVIFLTGGLYFAVLLSSAPREWPRWATTALVVEIMVEIGLYQTPLLPAVFDALGHALGALAGAYAVRVCRGLPFQLTTLTDVLAFSFAAAIVCPSVGILGPYGTYGGHPLLAQSFLALTSICALCLSAVIEQYQAAQAALRHARDDLENRVLERTAALAESERQLREGNALFAIARAAAKITTLEWIVASNTLNFSDDPAWLLGPLPASGAYPLFTEQIHPDDRARFVEMRQRALDTLQGGTFEFRVVRTDHIVLWVQSYQTVFAGANGKVMRLVAAVQDISARKLNESSLRASEQRLRALLDGIPERAWLKDADGRYIAANRALVNATSQSVWVLDAEGNLTAVLKSLTGKAVADVHGRNWLDFVHPDDREGAAAAMQAAMSSKSAYEHEFRVLNSKEGWRDVLARAVPVMHADGAVREWIGTSPICRDRRRRNGRCSKAIKPCAGCPAAGKKCSRRSAHASRTTCMTAPASR